MVRPDVLFVGDGPPDGYLRQSPALVAEVLSEATRERDLNYKRELYQQKGVENYLAVDPDLNQLTSFGSSSQYGWAGSLIESSLELRVCGNCQVIIETAKLFR